MKYTTIHRLNAFTYERLAKFIVTAICENDEDREDIARYFRYIRSRDFKPRVGRISSITPVDSILGVYTITSRHGCGYAIEDDIISVFERLKRDEEKSSQKDEK